MKLLNKTRVIEIIKVACLASGKIAKFPIWVQKILIKMEEKQRKFSKSSHCGNSAKICFYKWGCQDGKVYWQYVSMDVPELIQYLNETIIKLKSHIHFKRRQVACYNECMWIIAKVKKTHNKIKFWVHTSDTPVLVYSLLPVAVEVDWVMD